MKLSALIPVVLGCVACTASAQNLLTNGSFETPGPGFVEFANWENYGNVFTADIGEVAAQDGSFSAKMFGASSGDQSDQVLLQTVSATPGELYTLSGYCQNRSADALGDENILLLQIQFVNSGGETIEAVEVTSLDPDVDPMDTWVYSEVSGISPTGTTQIIVAVLHIQLGTDAGFPNQGGGASFWDNIQLIGGEAPCSNPADFNGDGVLNFFDITAFLQSYGQGC